MKCRACFSNSLSVVDSRADGDAIRRRRHCNDCGFRFTTYERVELSFPMVVKKDGERQPFDREKVKTGIIRACVKRPVTAEMVSDMVESIERSVCELNKKEISASDLGELIAKSIQKVDPIAYIRFASVYKEFSDVNQFVEILKSF